MQDWFLPTQNNNYKPRLLNHYSLSIYTLVLFLLNVFGTTLFPLVARASDITSGNIVSLTNQEREKYGLPDLKTNIYLTAAAQLKANNMFKEQYWDHFGPNGESPWQFIKQSGYSYVYAGENLAKGFQTSEGVVQAWMASPTHRENLLSGNYKDIGIAAVSGKLLGEDVILVVQMFGNTTYDVVKANVPTIPNTGTVGSLEIVSPKNGDILNDAAVDIRGEVNVDETKYKVNLTEGTTQLGSVETNGKEWIFDKKADWSEGTHSITATIKQSDKTLKDSVNFTIDSKAPNLIDNTIDVQKDNDNYVLSFMLDDPSGKAQIVVGSHTFEVKKLSDRFQATIPVASFDSNVIVITSDDLGNTKQTDITKLFGDQIKGVNTSNLVGIINSISSKDNVNKIFIGFILLLLILEILTFVRKGMFKQHAGHLMSLSIWLVILSVGVITGFRGVII